MERELFDNAYESWLLRRYDFLADFNMNNSAILSENP